MAALQAVLYTLLSVAFLKLFDTLIKAQRIKNAMPPRPPGLPIFGNAFQLGSFQWLKFAQWKERCGPIFSLDLAGQPMVVLNDFETAAEFLDRRSTIYSDRPRFIMSGEIISGDLSFISMHYTELWRRMRKVAHEAFNGSGAVAYRPVQEKRSTLLLAHLLEDPAQWNTHIGHSIATTMLATIYDWPLDDPDTDTLVEQIYDLAHRISYAGIPGNFLVEMFPAMLYLPEWMAKWKREGRAFFRKDTEMFIRLMNGVNDKMAAGTVDACFAAKIIDDRNKHDLNEAEMAWLAGSMFFAGSETTTGILNTCILALVLHPEVMRRAQTQLDAVVGRDRLPTFSDQGQLPYIDAIVREVMRWRPAAPVGVPRRATQDDWYKGYFIPKGTVVIYNVWSINRDSKYFPDDADIFRPERYLDDSGELRDFVPESRGHGHLTFGSGRRICVGRDVANQMLFIVLASILWSFKIEKAVDACGNPITPAHGDLDLIDDGIVVHPKPFKCSITPRSPDAAAIIRSAAANAA